MSRSDKGDQWVLPREDHICPPILEQWPAIWNTPPELDAYVREHNGLTVEVEASAQDDDDILDYEWYFGDLQRGKGPNVYHHYRFPGCYEILCYTADRTGTTSWQIIPVTVP